jgi:hypothetical protein
MAVYRTPPKCIYCGKPIASEIHKEYKGVPSFMIPYGDSFIGWKYRKFHICLGKIKEFMKFNK